MSKQHNYNLRSRGQSSEEPPPPPPSPPLSPQTTTRLRRTSSHQRCAICLDTLSEPHNTALFLLCTHTFDLTCSITLLTSPPSPQSRRCPLCRIPIAAVQYNFLSSPSSSSIHIPRSPIFDSGPFIREDETVTVEMSELEKNRRRELKQLIEKENLEKVVLVERIISSKVMQLAGTKTVALLVRSLSIIVVDKGLLRRILDIAISGNWAELKLEDPEFKLLRDEKGLEVSAKKFLMVERKFGAEDITITDCTSPTEIFPSTVPPNWDGDGFNSDTNIVNRFFKAARLRAISLARQEIQGVFELFRFWGSFEDLTDLDIGSSAIMDTMNQGEVECEYCDEKHRNGDCKLPDAKDVTGNVRVDKMQM
ncbi:uncharacterized protein PAC_06918 [Phialocephala subalpina]|uniref:RING-type domain-containing protein n=1 Tax=Phialocephala subalpina TaxID=576137 RepID=A0A1L7WWA1_9HELO|nr:uncharacterized protein PAC_06918 [Phialocephala subalpina]